MGIIDERSRVHAWLNCVSVCVYVMCVGCMHSPGIPQIAAAQLNDTAVSLPVSKPQRGRAHTNTRSALCVAHQHCIGAVWACNYSDRASA